MKEVTYEDWQKNPIPRVMWVWCDCESEKKRCKAIYVLSGVKGKKYNVLTVADKETCTTAYTHCAEIEKQKTNDKQQTKNSLAGLEKSLRENRLLE